MARPTRIHGAAALIAVLLLALLAASMVLAQLAHLAPNARRDAASDRALASAREALLAYAADRPIGNVVGPGYLPCPDLDGDGWAEPICGSLDGDRGNAERLGQLPWKTLGVEDLRDGHGERLWYAVATKFKGLLNCASSPACIDMSPRAARGTITVRDADGRVTHDGTLADPARPGAVAVVIAPGAALERRYPQARPQRRGDCGGRCDARDYLEAAPPGQGAEDNADFSDRLDAARSQNANGFIRGPVHDSLGQVAVNDRVLAIGEAELVGRAMRRVALELGQCLRFYASRPENGGRLPWPEAACGAGGTPAFGRVPDTPFASTRLASGGRMLDRWWRAQAKLPERLDELPTAAQGCRIAELAHDEGETRTRAPGSPPEEDRKSVV